MKGLSWLMGVWVLLLGLAVRVSSWPRHWAPSGGRPCRLWSLLCGSRAGHRRHPCPCAAVGWRDVGGACDLRVPAAKVSPAAPAALLLGGIGTRASPLGNQIGQGTLPWALHPGASVRPCEHAPSFPPDTGRLALTQSTQRHSPPSTPFTLRVTPLRPGGGTCLCYGHPALVTWSERLGPDPRVALGRASSQKSPKPMPERLWPQPPLPSALPGLSFQICESGPSPPFCRPQAGRDRAVCVTLQAA